jgi:hypothetical protein
MYHLQDCWGTLVLVPAGKKSLNPTTNISHWPQEGASLERDLQRRKKIILILCFS